MKVNFDKLELRFNEYTGCFHIMARDSRGRIYANKELKGFTGAVLDNQSISRLVKSYTKTDGVWQVTYKVPAKHEILVTSLGEVGRDIPSPGKDYDAMKDFPEELNKYLRQFIMVRRTILWED